VSTASAVVEIIQDSINFIDGKTLLKNIVDPTSIENVIYEEVLGGLMENVSTIISREMRPNFFCTKVDEKFVIPWVIKGDGEEVFIREILIDGGSFSLRGKGCNEFSEEKRSLYFGSRELQIVLMDDNDPSRKFSINLLSTKQVLHGIGIFDDLGSSK
jgi:hypothetical protein